MLEKVSKDTAAFYILDELQDKEFDNLTTTCMKADRTADNLLWLAEKWSRNVQFADQNFKGFNLANNYEHVANQFNSAQYTLNKTYEALESENEKIEKLVEKFKSLHELAEQLKTKANTDSGENSELDAKILNIDSKLKTIRSKFSRLNSTFERINAWKSNSIEFDTFLNNFTQECEVHNQKLSNLNASVSIIETIRVLDSIRNVVDSTSQENPEDESETSDRLAQTIEKTIDDLIIPNITLSYQKLTEANYTEDLDLIRREFEELKELMEITRQIASNINSPVLFNSSSFLSLRPPQSNIYPSLITNFSLYIKTAQPMAPIAFIFNESTPNHFFALYVFKGKVHLKFKLADTEPVTTLFVNKQVSDDNWHKISFERVAKLVQLKVLSKTGLNVESTVASSALFNIDKTGGRFVLGQAPLTKMPADIKRLFADKENQFKGFMDSFVFNDQKLGMNFYCSFCFSLKPI